MRWLMAGLMMVMAGLGARQAEAQLVYGTLAFTNAPINSSTFTVNGTVFTWTNGTPIGNYAVQITNTLGGDCTNLLNVAGLVLPFGGVISSNLSTNFYFSGIGLAASVSAATGANAWASLSFTTNLSGQATNVIIPIGVLDAAARTNIESQLVSDIWNYDTNAIPAGAAALTNFVSTNGTQTLWGKTLIAPYESSGSYANPSLTNGTNYGLPFRSPGTGAASEQFGLNANASGAASIALADNAAATAGQTTAVGASSAAAGQAGTAVGNGATESGISGTAVGAGATATGTIGQSTAMGAGATAAYGEDTAVGYNATTSAKNQVMVGTAADSVVMPGNATVLGVVSNLTTAAAGTNTLQGTIVYSALYNTAVTTGVNQDVQTFVNHDVFITSSVGGAFSIAGLTGGVVGREVRVGNLSSYPMTLLNQSGLEATAANRLTINGGSTTISGYGGYAVFLYVTGNSWHLVSVNGINPNAASLAQTNFVSGQLYTNLTGYVIKVSGSATLAVAAVAGNACMSLEGAGAAGSDTNQFAISTLITSIAMNYTNYLALEVPPGGTFMWTNRSTGTGNAAAVARGQLLTY
jgi:hypothetical protein